METLLKAIQSAKEAQAASLRKQEENKENFRKLTATVLSAMKELQIGAFRLDVPKMGIVNITEKGIETSFSSVNFTEERQKALIEALVNYFEGLATKYSSRL